MSTKFIQIDNFKKKHRLILSRDATVGYARWEARARRAVRSLDLSMACKISEAERI